MAGAPFYIPEPNHAGLVLRSPSAKRMADLVTDYAERFRRDFMIAMPAPEKSAH